MKRSLISLLSLQATPRGWRYTGFGTVLLFFILLQPVHSQPPIDVTITVDNAYVFGFGDVNGITPGNLFGGVDNCTAGDIYDCADGPEPYPSLPVTLDGYIYIVTWSDESVWQGTIAEFTNGVTTILTQPGLSTPWEVFATGIDIDPNCAPGDPPSAPSLADINNQIALANASAGPPGSSVTWVNENSPGSNGRLEFHPYVNGSGTPNPTTFPPGNVCGIGLAQWMTYNSSPGVYDPFCMSSKCPGTGIPPDMLREYYIFRIGPLDQTLTIPTLSEWAMIVFAVLILGLMTYVVIRKKRGQRPTLA